MERYRSGYNGTVLKTVVRQRTVGSNPTLSAIKDRCYTGNRIAFVQKWITFNKVTMQKYSSWWRGAPAKGVGRETGARVRVSPSAPEEAQGIIFVLLLFGSMKLNRRDSNSIVHLLRSKRDKKLEGLRSKQDRACPVESLLPRQKRCQGFFLDTFSLCIANK